MLRQSSSKRIRVRVKESNFNWENLSQKGYYSRYSEQENNIHSDKMIRGLNRLWSEVGNCNEVTRR